LIVTPGQNLFLHAENQFDKLFVAHKTETFLVAYSGDVNKVVLARLLLFCAGPRFSAEEFGARIASERRLPTRSTHSIPGFVPLRSHFTFFQSGSALA
jgi:hypothetical protein